MISKSSSEDELGVGDYTRKHANNKKFVKISKELGYASDPEVIQNSNIITVCTNIYQPVSEKCDLQI